MAIVNVCAGDLKVGDIFSHNGRVWVVVAKSPSEISAVEVKGFRVVEDETRIFSAGERVRVWKGRM